MVDNAATIWRDYVTDGVPSSGKHEPRKSDTRAWGTDIEGRVDDLSSVDIIPTSATSYTVSSEDNQSFVRFTSSSAVVATLPSGLAVGFFVVLAQEGTGQVTAAAGAGASLAAVDGAVKTGGQYAAMVAVCVAANTWRIYNGVS